MRARIQTIPTEGGGGWIASRGRFVPFFSSRKQMATYDFHGEVRTPCPLCLRLGPDKHTGSEVSAYIRVSNSLNSHFIFYYFFFCWAWSMLIISDDAKGKDSMILFKIKETAHINSGHVLF